MKKNVQVIWIGASLLWLLIAVGKSQAGLYGFGVNRVGSDYTNYTNELYALDATLGVVTQVLAAYPDISAHALGLDSVDPASGRLYKWIETKSDMTERLYTIDLRTGALLSSPTIDMGNTNRSLQRLYAFDGALYGFGVNRVGSDYTNYTNELYALDATLGVVTQVLGVYPDISAHALGLDSVDPASGRLYKWIETKSDSTERLYTIDLRTGALLSSPTIDTGNTNRSLQMLYAVSTKGPLIKANGQLDNLTMNTSDNLSITVQIDPGEYSGGQADWWIIALAGSVWYYLNSSIQWTQFDGDLSNCRPVYQGALFNLPVTEVLNAIDLSAGSYYFWFAVDYPADGILDQNGAILYDQVTVTVQ